MSIAEEYLRYNTIIANNLAKLLESRGMSQTDLALYLGVSKSSVSSWIAGKITPRMKYITKICELFGCELSDLTTEPEDPVEEEQEQDYYYLNEKTREIAQEIYDNKELSILFDAARDVSPEDLQAVQAMVLALKRKEERWRDGDGC